MRFGVRRYSAALGGIAWAAGHDIQSPAIADALQISDLREMRSRTIGESSRALVTLYILNPEPRTLDDFFRLPSFCNSA